MKKLKIATWNVNSLRVRLPHVLTWLQDVQPDILAVQEIKMPDADFPFEAFKEAGYFAIAAGQKTYNGVAIFSRHEAKDIVTDFPDFNDQQRRVLAATIDNVRILNLYVPNGQSIESDKYAYKLNWIEKLDLFLKSEIKSHQNMVVLGDFNIAPHDIDVHDPKQWEGQVLCSAPEREAFHNMLQVGFEDCFRKISPTSQEFSWWDYRMNAFKRNIGLRIDHILASNSLSPHCVNCYVDKAPRKWERPSDHAPVIAEFNIIE